MKIHHKIIFWSIVIALALILNLNNGQTEENYYRKTVSDVHELFFASYGSMESDDLETVAENRDKIDTLASNLSKVKTSSETHEAENLVHEMISASYELMDAKIDLLENKDTYVYSNDKVEPHDVIFEKSNHLLELYEQYNENLKTFVE
ncbi:hypothetical protein [Fusibacter ferrireducens]|uniref:DUF4363 domain-containing protein n=1 Tax=Fusibacter ferrireducens TaxID=2785058 RepID=A0ABR9ZRN1_9FIRM|nr:hypothetical protein [Fusibacter ferrireducens]MBF4693117.1 hypothetical protein [Fusibacter ferrireducens]